MPSYIALAGWLILGLIFFVVRYPKLKNINKDELSRLILDTSQAKVESMIDEPDSKKKALESRDPQREKLIHKIQKR